MKMVIHHISQIPWVNSVREDMGGSVTRIQRQIGISEGEFS